MTVAFLVSIRETGDAYDDTVTDLLDGIEHGVQSCRLDYTDIQIIEGQHLPDQAAAGWRDAILARHKPTRLGPSWPEKCTHCHYLWPCADVADLTGGMAAREEAL